MPRAACKVLLCDTGRWRCHAGFAASVGRAKLLLSRTAFEQSGRGARQEPRPPMEPEWGQKLGQGSGEIAPSPPTPLPRFTGARGGICVFKLQWKARRTPLAPGRGEGSGVRGEGPLVFHAGRRAMRPHAPRGQPRAATVRERECLAHLARCCCVTLVAGAVMPGLRQVSGGRSSC